MLLLSFTCNEQSVAEALQQLDGQNEPRIIKICKQQKPERPRRTTDTQNSQRATERMYKAFRKYDADGGSKRTNNNGQPHDDVGTMDVAEENEEETDVDCVHGSYH